ncbi:MTH1187 family thiamine-binding protein [Arcobacter sp. YIC-80]|uniref:MTH1187 family thiamine-binding protein n=1 Tax=unclassified Arcobacter TaxID=2593671 RepID=UPI0038509E63
MSVLVQMAMFPTDKSESKAKEVSKVIEVIKNSGYSYQLTSMCTIIETNKMSEALDLIGRCYKVLEDLGCNRVYSTITFDIRKNHEDRMTQKIKSVESYIGEVSK